MFFMLFIITLVNMESYTFNWKCYKSVLISCGLKIAALFPMTVDLFFLLPGAQTLNLRALCK